MKSNQLILFAIISITTFLLVFNCQTARSVNALTKNGALAGVWTGAAICADDTAPCRDETLVVRVAEPDADGGTALTMSSFAENGTESTMRLVCASAGKDRALACDAGQSVWRVRFENDKAIGTQTLADGTIVRHLEAVRSEK